MPTLLRLMLVCFWLGTQDQKAQDHKGKPPAVDVEEMKARRNNDVIEVTAQVKNTGEKPLKNLEVIFKFRDSDGAPISTEEMKIDEPRLMPGGESTVNVQLKDSPRATQILIGAQAGGGVELDVGDSGPYVIE
jgi:hypothetical protein